jgi:hypothetical protein
MNASEAIVLVVRDKLEYKSRVSVLEHRIYKDSRSC